MNELWLVENKYEIISKIKQGGFGIVYVGFDQTFQRPIAIKAVETSLLNEAKYVDMFLEEAKNAAKLNHNNIVHVYDLVKKDEGQYYIIMEYINGVDLGQLLKKLREDDIALPVNYGIFIIKEICKALEYAHNKRDLITNQHLNLVHQDISPSNIMISNEGHVKLIDFGIAKLKSYKSDKSKDRQYVGKLPYLSPEQLNGGLVNKLTDIFSLGSVFYEILMNEKLFNQETNDEIVDAVRKVKIDLKRLDKKQVPAQITQILSKMLQKDPGNRYQGANGIYLDLVEYLMENVRTVELSNEFSDYLNEKFPELMTEIVINKGTRNHIYVRSDEVAQHDIESDEETQASGEAKENQSDDFTDDVMTPSNAVDMEHGDQAEDTLDSVAEIDDQLQSLKEPLTDDIDLNALDDLNLPSFKIEDIKSEPVADEPSEDVLTENDLDSIKDELEQEINASFKFRDPDPEQNKIAEDTAQTTPAAEALSASQPIITVPDDFGQGEDDEKTVIDVIRLSAKSRRRPVLLILGGILVSAIIALVLATYFGWSNIGLVLYDHIFPPAIKIYSSPEGAEVYLDGERLQGVTPLTVPKISPGVHQLKLIYAGYAPLIRSIQVPSSGQIKVSGETLRKGYEPYLFRFKSNIELQSDPAGAVIKVNGIELQQKTPTTIEWEIGLPLAITMKRDQSVEIGDISLDLANDQVHIEDNRLWSVQRVSDDYSHYLIKGHFKKFVSISSLPEGALVYIDNNLQPIGKTGSIESLPLSIGSHEITFVLDDFNTKKVSVVVDEQGTEPVFAALTRNVRFFAKDVTDPEDNEIGATIASITREGKTTYLNQETPCIIPVEPYDFQALVQKDGYENTHVSIPSTTREVIIRMKPADADVEVFVFDASTNSPLGEAQIMFRGINENSAHEVVFGVTDDFGRCKRKIEYGDYVFRAKKDGYFAKSTTFNTDQGRRLEFKLNIQ